MAQIVIIGAGLTGLSAAYHLEQKGFFDYRLFEKESQSGGLCRSVQEQGFTFDFTGHLLHINDDYFRSLIHHLAGFQHFNSVNRRSWIYSQDTYTPYPYQINLRGLPTTTIAECIQGFIARKNNKNPKTFYDWVLAYFGAGFGKHFFFPYQQKIFAYHVKKLTASWTGRFVPATSLEQIIDGITREREEQSVGYNAHFFYPSSGGISFLVDCFEQSLVNPVYHNFCVERVDVHDKIVHFTNGHTEPYEYLITTMPLDNLLKNIREPSSSTIQRAAGKLLCNSVVNFNLGIARSDLSDKHWVYFPESRYPFYRIGFPHNFSTALVPNGCSSLYGEFAHLNKSRTTVARQLRTAIKATKDLFRIQDEEVMVQKVLYIPHAYVIYDAWREKHLPNLLKTLANMNVYSVGRYGEWKYASMQEAILDGKAIVDKLLFFPAVTTPFVDHTIQPTTKQKEL